MTVVVAVELNGVRVPLLLDEEALSSIAASVVVNPEPSRPYLTVAEAALYLRCKRQRIDDLLSQGRLTRIKEGRRTLVSRAQIEEHLQTECR